ncbi:MAG: hypothetical protein J1F67_00025 [Muribaculaceae bacterium]|nr:hypothetical protein [Muribaculaceae bacterium]
MKLIKNQCALLLCILVLSIFMSSCKGKRHIRINEESAYYVHTIGKNILLTTSSYPYFKSDSISKYKFYSEGGDKIFIGDIDNQIFFCSLISEEKPAIIKKGIYTSKGVHRDKVLIFIYEDTLDNSITKNRIFVGTPLLESYKHKNKDLILNYLYDFPM